MVARYLGVVEAVGSNPATQTNTGTAFMSGAFFFAIDIKTIKREIVLPSAVITAMLIVSVNYQKEGILCLIL